MSSYLPQIALLLLLMVTIGWYLTYTAARLDRLHVRLTGTRASLEVQRIRRADAAIELAHSGVLDGATALILANAAAESIDAGTDLDPDDASRNEHVEQVENDLTEALNVAVTPELVEDLVDRGELATEYIARLTSACTRVQLARRFHNDAVTDVRRVRRQRAVRWFRLAGHTPMPVTIEFNDELPDALITA